jgi:hypothetical protein
MSYLHHKRSFKRIDVGVDIGGGRWLIVTVTATMINP